MSCCGPSDVAIEGALAVEPIAVPEDNKTAEEEVPESQKTEAVIEEGEKRDLEVPAEQVPAEETKETAPETAACAEKKGRPRSCARCCKYLCCCCCSCVFLLLIAGIVVFNTILKVDLQNPPAPAAPTADLMLGVSYSGSSDPNGDATFKSSLVSGILGALPGSLSDADGSIASSLQFSPSRRLDSVDGPRELTSNDWTVVMPLVGEAAVSATDVFTSHAFHPDSISGVTSVSVSSEMSVLAMGHLLKDMNFVCRSAFAKALDKYRTEIVSSLEKDDVSGVTLGINEEGWVWASFKKSGWKYSATALGCEASQAWEKAIESALDVDLGACSLSAEGIQAVVSSGRGGDECYIDNIKNLVHEYFLMECPAAGDSMCSSSNTVCEDFEYPGCSSCPSPATVRYLPCAPFN